MVNENTHAPVLLFVAVGAAIAAFGALALGPGCSGGECAIDPLDPNKPVTGIDCPSGDLCYIGQCFRGCNPGSERFEPCATNEDCKNAARPNCVFANTLSLSFCSTCEEGETCVLGLNICRPVSDIPDPEPPMSANNMNVPLPLDGGQIDGSTFEDAGVEVVAPLQPDYAGYVSLIATVDAANDVVSTVGAVNLCDTRSATVAQRDDVLAANGQCEVRRTTRFGGPFGPANLGEVRFFPRDETPGSMTLEDGITARVDMGSNRYVFTPTNLPDRLLVFSTPPQSNSKYVQFTSSGIQGVTAPEGSSPSWPPSMQGLLFVPFEFVPLAETETLMENAPIRVSRMAPTDLLFRWVRAGENDVPGESIIVEIGGQRSPCENRGAPDEQVVLRCIQDEVDLQGDPVIQVREDSLRDFITALGPEIGDSVTVRFGRLQRQQLSFDANIDVQLYFGQEYVSRVEFSP